jgi:hypothetical protein
LIGFLIFAGLLALVAAALLHPYGRRLLGVMALLFAGLAVVAVAGIWLLGTMQQRAFDQNKAESDAAIAAQHMQAAAQPPAASPDPGSNRAGAGANELSPTQRDEWDKLSAKSTCRAEDSAGRGNRYDTGADGTPCRTIGRAAHVKRKTDNDLAGMLGVTPQERAQMEGNTSTAAH